MAFERLEPGTPEWIAYFANHQQRYAFAAQRLAAMPQPARVLDAATGVGYGAAQIADVCSAQVVAVDRDPAALRLARLHYARSSVAYEEDDCLTLARGALRGAPYSAAVSFETIEHLPTPDSFLQRVAQLLAPGGVLIASTPNRSVTAAEGRRWDYHEREYTASELETLLASAGFASIRLFGQRMTPLGELRRDMRAEIHRLRFNPLARLGFWLQQRVRGLTLPPALPEQPSDFEIVPLASAAECDRQGVNGPFVLIATAVRTAA
jgi:SAM-dependent methyltransferase